MKKILFISILLFIGCSKQKNKSELYFNQQIQVTEGFYKNCKGRLVNKISFFGLIYYKVELEYICDRHIIEIHQNEFKIIE